MDATELSTDFAANLRRSFEVLAADMAVQGIDVGLDDYLRMPEPADPPTPSWLHTMSDGGKTKGCGDCASCSCGGAAGDPGA